MLGLRAMAERNGKRLMPLDRRKTLISSFYALGLTVFITVVLIIFTIVLYGKKTGELLQPVFYLLVIVGWVSYIGWSLSHLTTAVPIREVSPDSSKLITFGRRSMLAAIVLSIYITIPFAKLAILIPDSFGGVLPGQSALESRLIELTSDGVTPTNWIAALTIPSLVAIGFGFITAYVTSFEWYDYYHRVQGAGLLRLYPNRKGRSEENDDLWFGELSASEGWTILMGATLGGWFKNWRRMRASLIDATKNSTKSKVTIILPSPDHDFLWERRRDELSVSGQLRPDLIGRYCRTLEILYLCFLAGEQHSASEQGSAAAHPVGGLDVDDEIYSGFRKGFKALFKEELADFSTSSENKEIAKKFYNKQIEIFMWPGLVFGANIFARSMYFVPYIPTFEDKDCPMFEIFPQSDMGRNLMRSVESIAGATQGERNGDIIRAEKLASSEAIIHAAFRLWDRLQRTDDRRYGSLPAWMMPT